MLMISLGIVLLAYVVLSAAAVAEFSSAACLRATPDALQGTARLAAATAADKDVPVPCQRRWPGL
jgi:hypothetical protein